MSPSPRLSWEAGHTSCLTRLPDYSFLLKSSTLAAVRVDCWEVQGRHVALVLDCGRGYIPQSSAHLLSPLVCILGNLHLSKLVLPNTVAPSSEALLFGESGLSHWRGAALSSQLKEPLPLHLQQS